MYQLSKSILIVDDSPDDRYTYKRYLQQEDKYKYLIWEAELGEEALQHCQEHLPDLILLDYQLPDLNGIEFLEQLDQDFQGLIPVIMLTGQGNERVAVKALKAGVEDYLIKSDISPALLQITVFKAIEQFQLKLQLSQIRERQRLISLIALRIRQSLELSEILDKTVREVRSLLEADRVIVYQFRSDWSGTIVAESVGAGWTASLRENIQDSCFQTSPPPKYIQGQYSAIANIDTAPITDCHRQLLQQFEVKANLVVPILLQSSSNQNQLWGLLILHQCNQPRQWRDFELSLLQDLSVQIAIAIGQAELYNQAQVEIAQRQISEQRLQQALADLSRSNQELEKYAYVTSHDLREPLRHISCYTNLLAEEYQDSLDGEAQEYIKYILSSTARMRSLIADLLVYARVGREQLNFKLVDFHVVLDEVLKDLKPAIETNQAQIQVESLPKLEANRAQIIQLWQNLIVNAIKYRRQTTPKILIAAQPQNDGWLFKIQDNGIGIEPQYSRRIFDVFQRLHPRHEYAGTGIGLAICYRIVERHGGKIWVESNLNQGSTFYFTLPKLQKSVE